MGDDYPGYHRTMAHTRNTGLLGGERMKEYRFNIEQVQNYEVSIDAENEEEAREKFKEYLTEEYGEPTNSVTHYVVECGSI